MQVAQQKHKLDSESIPVYRIFEWSKTQLQKCDELYHKRKKEVITLTAEKLEAKGFPVDKICSEISKQLSNYIDDAYVREVLPSKYKDQKQQKNAISGVENHAKQAVHSMVAEAYDINQLETYSKAYLIEIVRYLDNVIQVNCKQTNERMEQELGV
jgi:hypothetical protein